MLKNIQHALINALHYHDQCLQQLESYQDRVKDCIENGCTTHNSFHGTPHQHHMRLKENQRAIAQHESVIERLMPILHGVIDRSMIFSFIEQSTIRV